MEFKKTVKRIKAKLAYLYAKVKADKLEQMNHTRYYILMADNGKLVVMDKSRFYALRKRGIMPKQYKPHMLTQMSLYYTKGTYKGKAVPAMSPSQSAVKKRRYLTYIIKKC